ARGRRARSAGGRGGRGDRRGGADRAHRRRQDLRLDDRFRAPHSHRRKGRGRDLGSPAYPPPGPSRRREGRSETLPQAGGEESNEIPPRTGGTNKEDDMASASDIVKRIKDEEIEWVDLRFTDPKGKWQHLTMVASILNEDTLEEGLMFDGSSIAGWKTINESDMILKPDLEEVWMDPFSATP